jgi:DNA-binding beta-propeller fold protein YncE
MPANVRATLPFSATIERFKGDQRDVAYAGAVELSFIQPAPEPSLVLSEFVAASGELEIANAGRSPVEFRGSLRAMHQVSGRIVEGAAQQFDVAGTNGPVTLAPGERLWIGIRQPFGHGGLFRRITGGLNSICLNRPAALLLENDGELVDIWVGPSYLGEQIPPNAELPMPLWEGPGAAELIGFPIRFRRIGPARTRSRQDWETLRETAGLPKADLRLPLLAAPRMLPVEPPTALLAGGVWSGSVAVTMPATGHLRADDLAGHPARSADLMILPLPRLTLSWSGTNQTSEAGSPLLLRMQLAEAPPTPLEVRLEADLGGELEVPASVTILAGQTIAVVPLLPVDDGIVDGTRTVSLAAAAAGYRLSDRVSAVVNDASRVRVSILVPSRVEVPKGAFAGFTEFPMEILLDQPAGRDLVLPLATELIHPQPNFIPGHGGPAIPLVTIEKGATGITVQARANLGNRHYPARYQLSVRMADWLGAPAEMEIVPTGPNPPWSFTQAAVNEGSGPTNALRIDLPALLSEPLAVRVQSTPHPLVAIPSEVIIPPYTPYAWVPAEVGDNSTDDGPSFLSVEISAPGFSPGAAVLRLEDDDASYADLSFGIHPTQPQVFPSGETRQALFRLLSGPISNIGQTAFEGDVAISLDAGTQAVTYGGPERITYRPGQGLADISLTGAAWNVRLRLTLPDGREVFTGPFDVAPAGSSTTEPADLAVLSPRSVTVAAATAGELQVTITNRGPGAVARVGLRTEASGAAVLGTGFPPWMGLGPLAAGESREVKVAIKPTMPGLGSISLSLVTDHPDPNTNDNVVVIALTSTNPATTGRRERVLASADLAYSASRNRFYVAATAPDSGEILELDPATAGVTRRWPLPAAPGLLAVTSEGQRLYALINAGTELVRFELEGGTTNLHFRLPAPASDFCIVPGYPQRTTVALEGIGVQLFENATRLGAPLSDFVWLEPDATQPRSVGYSGNVHFYQGSGGRLTLLGVGSGFFGGAGPASGFRLSEGRIHFADGSQAGMPGSQFVPGKVSQGVDLCLDGELIHYAVQRSNVTEVATFSRLGHELGRQFLPAVAGQITRLTRWGARGLAFRTTAGQVVFLDSPLIPDATTNSLATELSLLPPLGDAAVETVRLRVVNSLAAAVAGVRTHLAWDSAHAPDLAGLVVESQAAGSAVVRLPEAPPNGMQELLLRFRPAAPGMRWLKATVSGPGREASPEDNSTSLVWAGHEIRGPKLNLTVADLAYEGVSGQFVAAVNAVGTQPLAGLLTLDSTNGRPRHWLPLAQPAEALKLSDDGTVAYLLSSGRNEVRRVQLDSGRVDLSFTVGNLRAVSDWMIPAGRPDLLLLSRNRTDQSPAYVDVGLYEMGVRKGTGSIRPAGVLAPAAASGEFYGGDAEGVDNRFHRFRWDAQGITWVGLTGSRYDPNSRGFLPLGDRFIGNRGDVHRRADGAWEYSLPFAPFVRTFGVNPTQGTVLSAPPLTVWDATSAKALRERPVTEFELADKLAVSASGSALLASSAEPGILFVSAGEPVAAQLSVRWETAVTNVLTGELIPTWITVSNAGPSSARWVSVPLGNYPAEAVRWETKSEAQLVAPATSQQQIVIDELPPGTSVSGRLDLRGVVGQLLTLNASPSSMTFQPEVRSWAGPLVLVRPSAIGAFVAFSGPLGDVAVDRTRKQLWAVLAPPQPGLAVFDLNSRTLAGTVALGFAPRRLVVSDDGGYLYAIPTNGPITRVNLASRQPDLTIPLGNFLGGEVELSDLVPLPGQGASYAVSLNLGNRLAGIWVADGAIPRASFVPAADSFVTGHGNLTFAGADRLLVAFGTTLHRLRVSGPNLVPEAGFPDLAPPGYPWLTVQGDFAYFHGGRIVNANDGTISRDYPGSSHLVPDLQRDRIMTVTAGFGFSGGRLIQGFSAATGQALWSASAGAGQTSETLGVWATDEDLVMRTGGFNVPGTVWLLPLSGLTLPVAQVAMSGGWNPARVPQGYGAELTLTLSNATPWIARQVSVQLPDDFDASFTNVTVRSDNVPSAAIERRGQQLILGELPATGVVQLRLMARGRPDTGEFAPKFVLSGSEPPLGVPVVTAPSLQVVTAPGLSLNPVTVTEGDSSPTQARVRITLSAPAVVSTVVRVQATPGTATGTDYLPPLLPVIIAPGAIEGILSIPLRNDLIAEPTEQFTVRVTEVLGARALQPEAAVTILDNDWPVATTGNVTIAEGNEGQQWVQVQLRLASPPFARVRLGYATVPRSAEVGLDFIPLQGTLTLAPGQTNAVLAIAILGDRRPEPDEEFKLIWFGAEGVRLPNETAVLIENDDVLSELRASLTEVGPIVRLWVNSDPGSSYRLERAPTPEGHWLPIGSSVAGTGTALSLEDLEPWEASGFYRVVREP